MIGIEPLDSLCSEADQKLEDVVQWAKEMGAKYKIAPIVLINMLEGRLEKIEVITAKLLQENSENKS